MAPNVNIDHINWLAEVFYNVYKCVNNNNSNSSKKQPTLNIKYESEEIEKEEKEAEEKNSSRILHIK